MRWKQEGIKIIKPNFNVVPMSTCIGEKWLDIKDISVLEKALTHYSKYDDINALEYIKIIEATVNNEKTTSTIDNDNKEPPEEVYQHVFIKLERMVFTKTIGQSFVTSFLVICKMLKGLK